MPRLVDADALLSSMGLIDAVKYGNTSPEQQHRSYSTWMSYEIADEISGSETVDAEIVKHGKWEDSTYFNGCTADHDFFCSFCNHGLGNDNWPYCPYCGAKMDL